MKILFIDDDRTVVANEGDELTVVRTTEEAQARLLAEHWDQVFFDHDMGVRKGKSLTTRPLALWLIENWAKVSVDAVFVHSWNPEGAEWLLCTLDKYLPVPVTYAFLSVLD